ncbi:MAG: EVE domain-containing protein [Gammaproteobacteria bacterium]|nr:EVE domain-containing protein [Gammaproteobacteria bacterium]
MSHWLLKSEPGVFSIDDLARAARKRTFWDGVRNYQARNYMRDGMRRGEQAFFYHSSCAQPGIAGVVEIVAAAVPDPTAFDPNHRHYDPNSDRAKPTWYGIEVRLKNKLARVITLEELKQHDALAGMPLLRRGNRLSVLPVGEDEWDYILALV